MRSAVFETVKFDDQMSTKLTTISSIGWHCLIFSAFQSICHVVGYVLLSSWPTGVGSWWPLQIRAGVAERFYGRNMILTNRKVQWRISPFIVLIYDAAVVPNMLSEKP